ncbi:retrovirus-related Pol polyprotein from transposon 412 [Trichonephila clavipes]|nr:retrovirus-related Pol polyprotein from transposon 412 [Trichonephila clavipes]
MMPSTPHKSNQKPSNSYDAAQQSRQIHMTQHSKAVKHKWNYNINSHACHNYGIVHSPIRRLTGREICSSVKVVDHFQPQLNGRRFLLRTDHASLTWLLNFKNPEAQIARWIQILQEYGRKIRHRKWSTHGKADALSRRLCPENFKY